MDRSRSSEEKIGWTDLLDGRRVPKDDARVEAIGSIDELSCFIGLARALNPNKEIDSYLLKIQEDLFIIGAELAGKDLPSNLPRVREEMIVLLDEMIKKYEKRLKPLTRFIIPGGCPAAATLHVARAVARRSERRIVTLSRIEPVSELVGAYMNRLSSLLFVLARLTNQMNSISETEQAVTST
jgi:cob(I)alamin adenosyltransferase